MADASRGAAAPISTAVRAAHPTTKQTASLDERHQARTAADTAAAIALPPLQLLQLMDSWLSETGHDARHPWRLSIQSTLDHHGEGEVVAAKGAGHVFGELANLADSLDKLLCDLLNGGDDLWPATFVVVGQLGWMADEAAAAHGDFRRRSDPADWLLSPKAREVIEAARRVTGATGEGA